MSLVHRLKIRSKVVTGLGAMAYGLRAPSWARHFSGRIAIAGVVGLLAWTSSHSVATASETRGYVVSWFVMASNAHDGDCPGGLNLDVNAHQRKLLKDMGKSAAEIDKLEKAGGMAAAGELQYRGRINDKPVYIYTNPATWPDPKIHTLEAKYIAGFNLDGRSGARDFIDPETQEVGIDDMAYRALGCYDAQRAPSGHRPSFLSSSWDTVRDAMPAWIIEVSGIDDPLNDDDVEVGVYHAIESMVRNPTSGDAQADITYQISPNPRMQNKTHGKIKNGILITNPFPMYMLGDLMYIPEYDFRDARLRLPISPSGPDKTVQGILGGYLPWKTVYWGTCGNIAYFCESTHSYDPTGIYYALSRMADAYPDPKTGENTHISTSFSIEVTTAFIVHPGRTSVVRLGAIQ
jgi:hypothetical protein